MAPTETAVFGGGCFWCTEAVFKRLKGVAAVTPGYAGGTAPNPDDYTVNEGESGHAEVVQIVFDPTVISYPKLLSVFWYVHSPTSLNRQGPDEGTQYRSVILYTSLRQKDEAEKSKREYQRHLDRPIVTEVKALAKFYPAESYHLDYYQKNPNQPYCTLIIGPKLEKFQEKFASLLGSESG